MKKGIFLMLFLVFQGKVLAQTWEKSGLTTNSVGAVETTPWGILAGEYDQRLWINPYNGLFISRNLGRDWNGLGLKKRGVTDIAYADRKIYASTFYFEENIAGLFVSDDGGVSWEHVGGSFSTSKVSASEDVVVLGTYSHGLWVSVDGGESWGQKLGDGVFGPQVYETASFGNLHLAATQNQTYISKDSGVTWDEITDLSGLLIRNIEVVDEQTVFAGTSNASGLYVSTDGGYSWNKNAAWGDNSVGTIKHYDGIIYAGRQNPITNKFDIYKSENLGTTWQPTEFAQIYNAGQAADISAVFSSPSLLFGTAPLEGVLKYEIPPKQIEAHPFLSPPWEVLDNNELIERIYSFFDHEYPIYSEEPFGTKNDTLNFLGIKEGIPDLFYSGHDGYDFALEYGTPVLAAAPGTAQYEYDVAGLGNSISIFHENGLKTVYGHLQDKGLITESLTQVNEGDQIGLTGVSGNTTGPHVHFSVETENGVIDPFGWQADFTDPWKNYSGLISKYLWKVLPDVIAHFIEDTNEIILGNKKLIIQQNSVEDNVTVFLQPYAQPRVPITQNKLTYVTGTSFLVNMYNILGEKPPEFLSPVTIEIDLSSADLENFRENSLKIYYWNEETQLWEPIPSVFDAMTRILTGETTHFSKYAVFGEKFVKRLRIYNAVFTIKVV